MKTSFVAISLSAASFATEITKQSAHELALSEVTQRGPPYQIDPELISNITDIIDVPSIADTSVPLDFQLPLQG